MPYGDIGVKQNKARLGEPGRGIIQFENASPQTNAELTRKVADKTELIESILFVTSRQEFDRT